jgi:hypothetical protein
MAEEREELRFTVRFAEADRSYAMSVLAALDSLAGDTRVVINDAGDVHLEVIFLSPRSAYTARNEAHAAYVLIERESPDGLYSKSLVNQIALAEAHDLQNASKRSPGNSSCARLASKRGGAHPPRKPPPSTPASTSTPSPRALP